MSEYDGHRPLREVSCRLELPKSGFTSSSHPCASSDGEHEPDSGYDQLPMCVARTCGAAPLTERLMME